jgi:hypothetical protein
MAKCKHRNSWLIGHGPTIHEWCYVCGSFRALTQVCTNEYIPYSAWANPTGDKDNNPYNEWRKRCITFHKRRGNREKKQEA